MSQFSLLLFAFLLVSIIHLPILPALPQLPDPEPAPLQTQSFLPAPAPPATIPAFPEQSNFDGCQLDLPDELFPSVKSACGSGSKPHSPDLNFYSGRLHKTRCCPVLAAWLYTAYSRTAIQRTIANNKAKQTTSSGIDMPQLPDDSETCVDTLEKALSNKGVNLVQPNDTCDAVYCYCGIRLHPLSCPEAFYLNSHGNLVGGERVRRLEENCFSSNSVNGYAGLNGCSKCLNTLYLLNDDKTGNMSKFQDRTTKMQSRDCELMGLTWLLNKNRTAYIHTVSAVLRALMMSTDGTDPKSCTLNSDGMPLAVDSSEINDQSSSEALQICFNLCIISLLFLYMAFVG